ncbi:hypothetical protein CERZMDRAFT_121406 [Cercospora zeae-maydis SCOH1-5]|uniref:Uncharacterized protein n=1 Tax=Cercospora zeae-maydis SCOH1-5 TaxID=717836 RepID=A0A6A6FEA7_9PEZI|nr:hypothetical protein CERZMDRAFT_121406 [Cercospora zeae-maydis SCOH1-5]
MPFCCPSSVNTTTIEVQHHKFRPLADMHFQSILSALAITVAATSASTTDIFAIGATAMTLFNTCSASPFPINIEAPDCGCGCCRPCNGGVYTGAGIPETWCCC